MARKSRAGRPRSADPATELLRIRVTPMTRALIEIAAGVDGVSVSEWVRDACAERVLRGGRRYTDAIESEKQPAGGEKG